MVEYNNSYAGQGYAVQPGSVPPVDPITPGVPPVDPQKAQKKHQLILMLFLLILAYKCCEIHTICYFCPLQQ